MNEYYNNWLDKYEDGRMIVIDIDKINYADNKEDLAKVIGIIEAEVNGLF